ncbi:MAG: carboxypeptidase regulatory-like domain-containing protein [Candidatus Eisenbacteria bacterium]|nr:carboxypeptidase regulatory-like domain-containing protein [Candidatus Eisenbacteria bacterium]
MRASSITSGALPSRLQIRYNHDDYVLAFTEGPMRVPSLPVLVGVLLAMLAAVALPGTSFAQLRYADSRYYTYDEITQLFEQWSQAYPQIFQTEIIGYTDVGHEPILAAKISDRVSEHEGEARLLFSAAQHGNEPNGTGAIMFMIDRLLTHYLLPGPYKQMVDNLEMWFVPVMNVEGHRFAFSQNPSWDVWRKTQRDNNGDGLVTYPIDGVDPNRNWNYRWSEYSESNYSSTRYKGPYPFSESCVVALRDLILREQPLFVTDLHSPDDPSQYNKVWWVWYSQTTGEGPDAEIYQPISIALGQHLQTEVDGVYVNGSPASYDNLPKEQCWVYANTGICTFLYEISRQDWWTGAMVDTIANRAGRGLFYLMDRALSGPGLKGRVTSSVDNRPLVAEVRVNQVHDPAIGPRLTEQFNGRYWRLLNSGSYTVTVSAPDHFTQTQSIYVGASGWTTLNFTLTADPAAVPSPDDPDAPRLWCDVPLYSGGAIHLQLARESSLSLRLMDTEGRQVQEFAQGSFLPGVRSFRLDPQVPSGSYLLQLRSGSRNLVKKVIVID